MNMLNMFSSKKDKAIIIVTHVMSQGQMLTHEGCDEPGTNAYPREM